jgi:quercetin dioxygenase-like cupin family protein
MTSQVTEHDPENRRTWSMWEECGMQFRSNTVSKGGRIPLHSHSYAHVAAVWGPFSMTTIDGEGLRSVQVVERGNVLIAAGVRHEFEYLGDTVGEVLCFWPLGHDGAQQ